ncbi:hypothetical protein HanXRQr2_Chr06g0240711 [Helianthus annuus]|uniref:Uncharacterized protein n=1 Tax=Helianthus annuus TaxID=4232 RepID=A0A9K3NHV5_HELAN|nr:hypothetical protein HanXRQr2_Chr06g0240711 [Helianthus annuus]KAJ0913883.1 hypothetical protein HanPSC8_Chr06g0232321 [Helianthus annuus]
MQLGAFSVVDHNRVIRKLWKVIHKVVLIARSFAIPLHHHHRHLLLLLLPFHLLVLFSLF